MMKQAALQANDITGAWAIIPTPAKPGASDWRATDTVDVDEAARAVDALVEAGVQGLLTMGTLGECATLTWAEQKTFMATIIDAARGRIPVFVGTTTLNTRETVERTRFAADLGATGTMLGIPMWCAPSTDVAVQFYQDVAEAVPEMNICIYANPEAFKFEFPRPFWARVSQIPQVVTAKYVGINTLLLDLKLTGGRIKLLPLDYEYYAAARLDDSVDAFWSSGASCGPIVTTTLRDVVAEARRTGDWAAAKAFQDRFFPSLGPLFPEGSFKIFSTYNISLEKERTNAAGWMNAGPVRPPYHITPESYLAGARKSGELWAGLARELESERLEIAAA